MNFSIKIIRLNIKEILFLILIALMVFYSFVVQYISPYFNYVDDLFTAIFILIAIIKTVMRPNEKRLNKYDKYLLIFGTILMLLGLIGNFISGYQTNVKAILTDLLAFCKWFGVYLAGMVILEVKKADRYYEVAEYFSKIILFIMLIILISTQIFHWDLADEYSRYGLPIYTLGGHPSFAAAIGACCISILLLNYSKNKKWILLGLILTMFTWRIKAIAYVILMIIFLIFNRDKKDFSIKKLAIYAVIAIVIASKYIVNYFFDLTASRGVALKASIELASKFFPIGSGFATFGTVGSTMSYSGAYEAVGINTRYGFMENASAFVGDGGWATEIGQFGILGVMLLITMFYMMYRSVKTNVSKTLICAPYISIFMYLLICSTSETSFSSNYAVLLAIALVIIVKKGQAKNETGTKEE